MGRQSKVFRGGIFFLHRFQCFENVSGSYSKYDSFGRSETRVDDTHHFTGFIENGAT
jgi:hypothetical protein